MNDSFHRTQDERTFVTVQLPHLLNGDSIIYKVINVFVLCVFVCKSLHHYVIFL